MHFNFHSHQITCSSLHRLLSLCTCFLACKLLTFSLGVVNACLSMQHLSSQVLSSSVLSYKKITLSSELDLVHMSNTLLILLYCNYFYISPYCRVLERNSLSLTGNNHPDLMKVTIWWEREAINKWICVCVYVHIHRRTYTDTQKGWEKAEVGERTGAKCSTSKCRARQYRVTGLLCLPAPREGLSEMRRSLNEERWNECREGNHSGWREWRL